MSLPSFVDPPSLQWCSLLCVSLWSDIRQTLRLSPRRLCRPSLHDICAICCLPRKYGKSVEKHIFSKLLRTTLHMNPNVIVFTFYTGLKARRLIIVSWLRSLWPCDAEVWSWTQDFRQLLRSARWYKGLLLFRRWTCAHIWLHSLIVETCQN